MSPSTGTVRVQRSDGTVTFELSGRATMRQSPAVRRFVEQSLASGATSIRFDLHKCLYMDSTFIGTLLALKREIDRRGNGEFSLVCPSSACQNLLGQLGLGMMFREIDDSRMSDDPWIELASEPEEVACLKSDVRRAHEELAELPGRAGEQFRRLAVRLAGEQNAGRK